METQVDYNFDNLVGGVILQWEASLPVNMFSDYIEDFSEDIK